MQWGDRMRALKILGWIVGFVLLTGFGLWLGGTRAAIWALEHPVSTMIARQIEVGSMVVEWGSPTRIVLTDVSLANASWGSEPLMFTAQTLELDVHLRTILWGPMRIPAIALTKSRLLLETSKDHQANWDFPLHSAAAPQQRTQFPELQRLLVNDCEFVFHNLETGVTSAVSVRTLQADDPDPNGPVKLAGEGRFQKLPLKITAAELGPIAQLRDDTKPYPVKLNGQLDRIHVIVDGTMGKPLDFADLDLRLSLAGAKLEELANALGVPMPDLPDFRATGVLQGGQGDYAIRDMSMKVGQSDIAGGIAIDTRPKVHYLKAQLTSSYLDLADFKGVYGAAPPERSAPPSRAATTPTDGRVLPDQKIDVSKLPGINIDLTFDGARIKPTGDLPFERVSLGLQIKDGELIVHPLRFHIAEGDVDLNLRFNPFTRTTPPHMVGDIGVRQVDLHTLLASMPVPDFVKATAGTVGGFIKMDTTGTSTREFLGRMTGELAVFMQHGQASELLEELAPINVLGATGILIKGDKPQSINCFVAHFNVKGGDATTAPVLMDMPDTQVEAQGDINFREETLKLHIVPRNKSLTLLSLRTPVDVTGTFAAPDFQIEGKGLAARLGAAIGLGIVFPPAALLPLIDTGLGPGNACSAAYAQPEVSGTSAAPPASAHQLSVAPVRRPPLTRSPPGKNK
jgi:AsmA family protein